MSDTAFTKEREFEIRYKALRRQCDKAGTILSKLEVPDFVEFTHKSGDTSMGNSIDCRLEYYINQRQPDQELVEALVDVVLKISRNGTSIDLIEFAPEIAEALAKHQT